MDKSWEGRSPAARRDYPLSQPLGPCQRVQNVSRHRAPRSSRMTESDILIVGSGAAGLTAALNLADRFKVTVLAKGKLHEGSTAWAQGGIAAVLEPGDTFDSHIEDTMVAGAGLNDRATV